MDIQNKINSPIPRDSSQKGNWGLNWLNGSQYLEQEEYDVERTRYLEKEGYKVVIRFWNGQVEKDVEGVVRVVEGALSDR